MKHKAHHTYGGRHAFFESLNGLSARFEVVLAVEVGEVLHQSAGHHRLFARLELRQQLAARFGVLIAFDRFAHIRLLQMLHCHHYRVQIAQIVVVRALLPMAHHPPPPATSHQRKRVSAVPTTDRRWEGGRAMR